MIEDVKIVSSDGKEWFGWENVQISWSTDNPIASFSFQSSKNPANLTEPYVADDLIRIFANDDLVLTGYIDEYNVDIDAKENPAGRILNINGRSKTGILQDSSVYNHFQDSNFSSIIKNMIKNFDIELETEDELWEHSAYTPEYGMPILDAIMEGLQIRGQVMSVTKEGNLKIWSEEEAERNNSAISIDGCVLEASISIKDHRRYSQYIAAAQDAAFFNGKQASEIEGVWQDTQFPRFKPRIFFPPTDINDPKAATAAERAAKRSFGKSNTVQLLLSGWRSSENILLEPRKNVFIEIPEIELAQTMTIQNVEYSQSIINGTTSIITLEPTISLKTDGQGNRISVSETNRPKQRPNSIAARITGPMTTIVENFGKRK